MRRTCISSIALMLLAGTATAKEAGTNIDAQATDLEVVLVTGEQPGPALWKVSSGNHELWILGEVSPLPRKVKWRSKQFEKLLAYTQEVILHNSATYMKGRQAAQMAHATDLPDGQSLGDLVSPELHRRIETVAKIYGVSEPLDALSPPVVATRFANASLKTLDVRPFALQPTVETLAHKIKVRVTNYSPPAVDIPFEEQVLTVKNKATAVCPLQRIVQVLEDGGSGLRRLANAWAVGDIDSLRRLVAEYGIFTDGYRWSECSALGQQQLSEYMSKRTASWLAEAERALRENRSTLAVVPMLELFEKDGYLAALRARGYEVVEPE
jgi:hypothetical protein